MSNVIFLVYNRWYDSPEGWSQHSVCYRNCLLVLRLRRYPPEIQPKDLLRKQAIRFNTSHGFRQKTSKIFVTLSLISLYLPTRKQAWLI